MGSKSSNSAFMEVAVTRTLLLCLALTACDTGAMHRYTDCRNAAGPEPHSAAGLFGPIGLLAANRDPIEHAWNDRLNTCMKEARR